MQILVISVIVLISGSLGTEVNQCKNQCDLIEELISN